MTQPAPEFMDADVLSLEVDLAEVTAEMPALSRVDFAESVRAGAGEESAAVPGDASDAQAQSSSLGESHMSLLRQAAQVLGAGVEPNEMLRALFNDIREPLAVDAYFNFMVNESGDALALASCAGIGDDEAKMLERLEFGQGICGNVALKRASIVAAEIQTSSDRRVQLVKSYGLRSYACNPLMSGERLIGTLSFASRTRDEFGPEDLEFFRRVAHAVAIAYERVRLLGQVALIERELDEMGRPVPDPLLAAAIGQGEARAVEVAPVEAASVEAVPTEAARIGVVSVEAAAGEAAHVGAASVEAAPGEAERVESVLVGLAPTASVSVLPVAQAVIDTPDVESIESNAARNEAAASGSLAIDAAADEEVTIEAPALSLAVLDIAAFEAMSVERIAPEAMDIEHAAVEASSAQLIAVEQPEIVAVSADTAAAQLSAVASAVAEPTPTGTAPSFCEAGPSIAEAALNSAEDVPAAAGTSFAEAAPSATWGGQAVTEATPTADESTGIRAADQAVSAESPAVAVVVADAPTADEPALAAAEHSAIAEHARAAEHLAGATDVPIAERAAVGDRAAIGDRVATAESAAFAEHAAIAEFVGRAELAAIAGRLASAGQTPIADEPAPAVVADEVPRDDTSDDEVLALALAAADAPTLEVLALALTVEDPPHHDAAPEAMIESEGFTIELRALDFGAANAPTVEVPALDLSHFEIAALDVRPIEFAAETPAANARTGTASASEVSDDEAPTLEVLALALRDLETRRSTSADEPRSTSAEVPRSSSADDDSITFVYVPPS